MIKALKKAIIKMKRDDRNATCGCRWERTQTKGEEFWNIMLHGIGVGLGVAAVALLAVYAGLKGSAITVVSTVIFGASAIFLYLSSTLCHARTNKKGAKTCEMLDNIAIYFLIAGTYTPFLLVNIGGALGWTFFGILWGVAIFGTILKFIFENHQPKWVVWLYLLMGWTLLFIIKPLYNSIDHLAFLFILLGGACYTFGVIFYLWRKLKYSHAIWHLLVIAGTVWHFFAILYGCILLK